MGNLIMEFITNFLLQQMKKQLKKILCLLISVGLL